jgi:c-di-GMP-binding flagellar brake protein YcgR
MGDDARREHRRFKKNLAVVIHRPYLEKRVEASDISLGGVALHNLERYYSVDETVYIELILEEKDHIYCNARVLSVYPHSKDASTYKLNLQFIDMSDADKEMLKSHIET